MAEQTARANLDRRLVGNPYPGRGIIVGRNDQEKWIQIYWIMGRSANSRNRLFVLEGETLRTQAADPSRVQDPSLIIYNAMRSQDGLHIVTNGKQTDSIHAGSLQGRSFVDCLNEWAHEPDAPNFTPRISAVLEADRDVVWMSVIKPSLFPGMPSEHHYFRYTGIAPGYGFTITTYTGDGDPLPAFDGTPYLVPLEGDAADLAAAYWQILDGDNRISLAVREIDPRTSSSRTEIVNKYAPATS